MDISAIVGFLGSITAAGLFFPQVWTSYRTKNTRDLSLTGIMIGLLNGIFWFTYGTIKNDPFIYVTNLIYLTGVLLLIFLKQKYK